MKDFKLKHFGLIESEPDMLEIINSVYGFDKLNKLQKIFNVKKMVTKVTYEIEELEKVDFGTLETTNTGRFTIPENIDLTSFGARKEVEQLLNNLNTNNLSYSQVTPRVIAIMCYENIFKEPYEEGIRFSILISQAKELPILEGVGFMNVILSKLAESNESWNNKFSEVSVSDPDFNAAGGIRLNRFNDLEVLEYACEKFNVDDKEAWKMSYVLIQNSLWKTQTREDVRHKMTKIKERRMKAQRRT